MAARACSTDSQRQQLVSGLAVALGRIHRTSPRPGLPDRPVEALLERARSRLARGHVPLRNFTARYGSNLTTPAALEGELERLQSLACRLEARPHVLLHGDPCLPNFLVDSSHAVIGCIDLAGVGLGDPYLDLALAHWSVQHNLGAPWGELFLEAYAHTVHGAGTEGDDQSTPAASIGEKGAAGAGPDGGIDRERLSFFAVLTRFLV